MHRKHLHFMEKSQLVLVAGLGLAAMYYLLWGLFTGVDPQSPVVFLDEGNVVGLLRLLVLMLAASLAVCLLTTMNRPVGAPAAVLIMLGGLSLRSARILPLLWQQGQFVRPMYLMLIAELVLLGAALIVMDCLIGLCRRRLETLLPRFLWTPLEPAEATSLDQSWSMYDWIRSRRDAAVRGKALLVIGKSIGAGVVAAVIVIFLLAGSGDRGQLLFAVFAGGFLGAMVGQHLFPNPYILSGWAIAPLAGVVLYAMVLIAPEIEILAHPSFQILPIDFWSAGGAGGLIGLWSLQRSNEMKQVQEQEEQSSAK
jgi:hypothetical protein